MVFRRKTFLVVGISLLYSLMGPSLYGATGPDFDWVEINGNPVSLDGSITVYMTTAETFSLEARVSNTGDDSPAGYNNITFSFPEFTSSTDKSRVSNGSATDDDLTYTEYFGSEAGGGDGDADYVMLEGVDNDGWDGGDFANDEENHLQVDIQPKTYGIFDIYLRAAQGNQTSWTSGWTYEPTSGYPDCLDFPAYRIRVDIRNPIDLVTISSHSFSPSSANPGDTLDLFYTISNPSGSSQFVGLGASIRNSATQVTIDDPTNDRVVTVPTGTSNWSRIFVIPDTVSPGTFDVMWGVHEGDFIRSLDIKTNTGALTINPTAIATPNFLDVLAAAADQKYGIQTNYDNNKKMVAYINGGYFAFAASIFIDLVDYMKVSKEGQNDWITVWIDGAVSVSLGGSIGVTKFDISDIEKDPKRQFLGVYGPSVTIPGMSLQWAKRDNQGNFDAGVNGTAFQDIGISGSLAAFSWNILRLEIKRDDLNAILIKAFLGANGTVVDFVKISQAIIEGMVDQNTSELTFLTSSSYQTRTFTSMDDGAPAQVDGALTYLRGGTDVDLDNFPDNNVPVFLDVNEVNSKGWDFYVSFRNLGNTATDYIVEVEDQLFDGWRIVAKDGFGTFFPDRKWDVANVQPNSLIRIEWLIGMKASAPDQFTAKFKLYQDRFGPINLLLDSVTVQFNKNPLPPVGIDGTTKTFETALKQNSPNPFNPVTVIRYSLDRPQKALFEIYSIDGQLVRIFERGPSRPGYFHIPWDGTDLNGTPLSNGFYLGKMRAGDYRKTIKMILQR